jgi:peptidase E
MGMSERRILALGGGALDGLMDGFILSLAGKQRPRVCLIPTAGGDRDADIVEFYSVFGPERAEASHLALFRRNGEDVAEKLLAQDVILVAGGNTENMLAVWRIHGVDRALRAAWEAGVVLCGASAGSLCWFETGTTDSFGPTLARLSAADSLSGKFTVIPSTERPIAFSISSTVFTPQQRTEKPSRLASSTFSRSIRSALGQI